MQDRKCKECKTDIDDKPKRQQFCCHKCSVKYNRKHKDYGFTPPMYLKRTTP